MNYLVQVIDSTVELLTNDVRVIGWKFLIMIMVMIPTIIGLIVGLLFGIIEKLGDYFHGKGWRM